MNVLLTGKRQVGKTTVCKQVAELTRGRGHEPAGVLAPALLGKDGLPVAYHALMVSDGEQWLLARANGDLDGPRMGRYSFDADVFSWVIERLRGAILQGCDLLIVDEIGPLELEQEKGLAPLLSDLIKEEIGRSQNGSPPQVRVSESRTCSGVLYNNPNKLGTPTFLHAGSEDPRLLWDSPAKWELPWLLLVVRPELIVQLQKRLPAIPFCTFTVTQENRRALPQTVVKELFADHDPGR